MINNLPQIGSIIKRDYDYVGVGWTPGTFTEVFTFKKGGASGIAVGTVTLVYTDATKGQLASVTALWV